MRRVLPALGLFFLAPLVGEFLFGNIPITNIIGIVLLFFSALLYGGGALFIREIVRRAGYGWPTIFAFALAYGVIEEGVETMSLFNPHYAGEYHLLDYGFIPALGIALPWTLFVLGLHVIWSISVPIALIETLTPSRRTTPWLGRLGLIVTAVLFIIVVVLGLLVSIKTDGFIASAPQFIGTGIATVAIVGIGILLGQRGAASHAETKRTAPSPWFAGVVSLVAGSIFMLIYATDPTGLSPWLSGINLAPWLATILYLVLFAGIAALVSYWSRLSGWSDSHRLALAGGALLTYAWHSFPWNPLLEATSRTADLASNTILAVGAVVLLVIAERQLPKSSQPQ